MSRITVPSNITNSTLFKNWLITINDALNEERELWDALNDKAPNYHADSSPTYGVGTSEKYGHLKITDTISANFNAANGYAISPSALYGVNTTLTNAIETTNSTISTEISRIESEIETAISNISSSVAGNYAPIKHLSEVIDPDDNPYGTGDDRYYGHLKLSDSITSEELTSSDGIAATPAAVNEVYTTLNEKIDAFDITNKFTSINNSITNLESSKAPIDHSSADTDYGIGTETLYGHLKITSNFAAWTDKTSADKTVSLKFISDLYNDIQQSIDVLTSRITLLDDKFDEYAPLSHIDVIGNNENIGHVKLTETFTENNTYTLQNGFAVSASAFQQFLYNGLDGNDSYYSTIENLNQQIQDISDNDYDNIQEIQNLQSQIGNVKTEEIEVDDEIVTTYIDLQSQVNSLDERIEDLEELPVTSDTLIFSEDLTLNNNKFQYALCICRNSSSNVTVTLSDIGANRQTTIKNESDYILTISPEISKTIDSITLPIILGKYDSVTIKQNPGENDINFTSFANDTTLTHSEYANNNSGSIEIFMTSRDANYFDINTSTCNMLIRNGNSHDSNNYEFCEKIVVLHSVVNTTINYPNFLIWMNNAQKPQWGDANETLILKLLQIGQNTYATVMHNSQIVEDLDDEVKG